MRPHPSSIVDSGSRPLSVAFLDLLRPAWRDSRAERRLLAVAHVHQQWKLAELASADPDERVRLAAMTRLADRRRRVSGIETLRCLARVANDGQYHRERLAALRAYLPEAGQPLFARLAFDADAEIRTTAISRLTDATALEAVARQAPLPAERALAIRRLPPLAHQRLLADLCCAETDLDTAKLALSRLNDVAQLERVALDAALEPMRFAAVPRLNDDGLRRVARSERSLAAQLLAVRTIGSQEMLSEIAADGTTPADVAGAAFDRLETVPHVLRVALGSPHEVTRTAAIARVRDRLLPYMRQTLHLSSPPGAKRRLSEEADVVCLQLAELALAAVARAAQYRDLVREFLAKHAYVIGASCAPILTTELVATAVEGRSVERERDLRHLLYFLRPDPLTLTRAARAFDEQLVQYRLLRRKVQANIARHKELLLALQAQDHSGFLARVMRPGLPLPLDSLPPWVSPALVEQLATCVRTINEGLAAIKPMDDRIAQAKADVVAFVDGRFAGLKVVDDGQSAATARISESKPLWRRVHGELFLGLISEMRGAGLRYETNAFAEAVSEAFAHTILPGTVRGAIVRSTVEFLRDVYKKSVQSLGATKASTFEVDGPAYLSLTNGLDELKASFLIVGPTVESLRLAASKGTDNSTTMKVQPGFYTIACIPEDPNIEPLIMEGECLPGRGYPIGVVLRDREEQVGVNQPVTLGRGQTIQRGLFGLIDIDPRQRLFVLYEGRRLHVGKHLGEGSGGIVYVCTDQSDGRDVAVKFMTAAIAGDSTQIDLGRREWQTYQSLRARDHVVPLLSCTENLAFMQEDRTLQPSRRVVAYEMELARLGSLQSYVEGRAGTVFTAKEIAEILRSLIDAMLEIHAAGLVHRDVRPANALVFEQAPRFRLCDFTLTGRAVDRVADEMRALLAADVPPDDRFHIQRTFSTLTSLQRKCRSSTFYASPEEHSGAPVDIRSDIYSLGGIASWLLTGFEPYELLFREKEQDLYESFRMATDDKLLHFDSHRSHKLFGELTALDGRIRHAALALKEQYPIELRVEEVETALAPGVFDAVRAFVEKSMQADPGLRFQTGAEMSQAFSEIEGMMPAPDGR